LKKVDKLEQQSTARCCHVPAHDQEEIRESCWAV
jgi:hypothetical protein